MSSIKLPEFLENKVSTRTYIARSSLLLNLKWLYENIEITHYEIRRKKRGRKKKSTEEEKNLNKHIVSGSIISVMYNIDNKTVLRGVQLKKKEPKSFRNCMTVVIFCKDNKKVNFKVSSNGTIQMTGCKSKDNAIEVLEHFWNIIKKNKKEVFLNEEDISKPFEFLLIPSMRNIDLNLGFNVNRSELSKIIRRMPDEDIRSMLEPSFGYTGGNVKFLLDFDIKNLRIDKITFFDDKEYTIEKKIYNHWLSTLSEKELNKKLTNQRYNTFLVFHSGKVIMSGIDETTMENAYNRFVKIIEDNYEYIKIDL